MVVVGGSCSAVYLLLHKHGLPSQPLHALKAIQSLLVLHTKLGGEGGRGRVKRRSEGL